MILIRLIAISFLSLIGCNQIPLAFQGGYDFPKSTEGIDTTYYYHPIKDIVSKRDSFFQSYAYLFYKPFNEHNISIRPFTNPVFRLVYSHSFGDAIVLVLTENELTVKEGNPSSIYSEDQNKLDSTEREHYTLLSRRYPIDTSGQRPFQKIYLDSMIKRYPQLLDVQYFKSLREKITIEIPTKFEYALKKIHITREQYLGLINDINSSGYWTLPLEGKNCTGPDEGFSYSLEANANSKYNRVEAYGCPDDTSKFAKVCQKIMNLAELKGKGAIIWNASVDTIKAKH